MSGSEMTALILSICAGVIALLTIWFSFVMAACEAAINRVTRTGLNNLSLDVQTDEDLTDFEKQKKLRKVAQVQKLVASRNATSSSASFMRIFMNVLTGVLLTFIIAQYTAVVGAGAHRPGGRAARRVRLHPRAPLGGRAHPAARRDDPPRHAPALGGRAHPVRPHRRPAPQVPLRGRRQPLR